MDYVRIRLREREKFVELKALNSVGKCLMKSPTEQEKKDVYEDEKEGLGTKPSPNLPFRKHHEKWI